MLGNSYPFPRPDTGNVVYVCVFVGRGEYRCVLFGPRHIFKIELVDNKIPRKRQIPSFSFTNQKLWQSWTCVYVSCRRWAAGCWLKQGSPLAGGKLSRTPQPPPAWSCGLAWFAACVLDFHNNLSQSFTDSKVPSYPFSLSLL